MGLLFWFQAWLGQLSKLPSFWAGYHHMDGIFFFSEANRTQGEGALVW
jgi:hypothetical protein